jgi:sugar lactone lactonase YvrE
MRSLLNRALKFAVFFGWVTLAVCPRYALAAEPVKPPLPPAFITALASDASGNVWLATEDEGMFKTDPSTGGKEQFKSKDGAGDDTFYAVAVDRLGRIWCGSLNHGVSVYNGRSWRVYGLDTGPLGARVFDIQCSPVDGDVWMATSAGLARYRLSSCTWSYYTRLDGLPADQVQSLAFNRQGDVIAGLQCGGIAIARAAEGHRQWTATAAPWYFDKGQRAPYPFTPQGEGLPSNLINCVLVTRDNTIWAATVAGLAWSRDNGRSWRFLRGRDYADRVKGLLGGAPKGWKPPQKSDLEKLLPEDYVTSLAEASDGKLWLGFRKQGSAELNPRTVDVRQWIKPGGKGSQLKDGYVNKLLPLPDGRILAAGYGAGLQCVRLADAPKPGGFRPLAVAKTVETFPPFPAPAAAPDDETLRKWTSFTQSLKTPSPSPGAAYLGEDWSTQGDWVNRYGRRFAMLCAMNAPWDNHPISSDREYSIAGILGPNFKGWDVLRHWIHWIKTDNPRSLFSPMIGIRRQADWDDHGETYPATRDGPDVWSVVQVPKGTHRISLYFFNKDGHSGANRLRDYLLEIRCYKSRLHKDVLFGNVSSRSVGLPSEARSWELTNAIPETVLVRSRVRDFWGGVYKTFVVQGPGDYYVRIARHGSFNAIVSGVFADKLPESVDDDKDQGFTTILNFGGVRYAPPDVRKINLKTNPELVEPLRLWETTQGICTYQRGPETFARAQSLAYRAALRQAPKELADNLRWHLRHWDAVDRRTFADAMTRAWSACQDRFVCYRSAEFFQYSPNVVPFSIAKLWEMQNAGVDWHTFIPTETTKKAKLPNKGDK